MYINDRMMYKFYRMTGNSPLDGRINIYGRATVIIIGLYVKFYDDVTSL